MFCIAFLNLYQPVLKLYTKKDRQQTTPKHAPKTSTNLPNIHTHTKPPETSSNDQNIEVKIGESLTGTIKKSELSREKNEQRTERFAVNEKVDAIIIQIDKKSQKLSLSIKAREIEEEKRAMADYGSSDSGASLGDILGAALAKKDDKNDEKDKD